MTKSEIEKQYYIRKKNPVETPAKNKEYLYFLGYLAQPTTIVGISMGKPHCTWTDDRWMAIDFKSRELATVMFIFLTLVGTEGEFEIFER